MSRRIEVKEKRFVELSPIGLLWLGENILEDMEYVFSVALEPKDAVNLASALLQYATQNADWWKVNGEAD